MSILESRYLLLWTIEKRNYVKLDHPVLQFEIHDSKESAYNYRYYLNDEVDGRNGVELSKIRIFQMQEVVD